METFYDSFHENEQIFPTSYLSTVDEVTKDQLHVLESIKADEKNISKEQIIRNIDSSGKEDFHQIMSDWQHHVELLHSMDSEDFGLGPGLGLDSNYNEDALNSYSFESLFEKRENTESFLKERKAPFKRSINNDDSTSILFGSNESKKKLLVENINSTSFQSCQKLCELMKGENRILGKVTVLNGEKEILNKNIVGLHCLNEIKENPQENCQVTSTVINGKRYKIIIKPKSLKLKKLNDYKVKESFFKRLKCKSLAKVSEPKDDEMISEMRNGNYNVPILESDVLLNWNLINLDSEFENRISEKTELETVKNILPHCVKIPKSSHKIEEKNSPKKTDETSAKKTLLGQNILGGLMQSFENKNTESDCNNFNSNISELKIMKIEEKSDMPVDAIKNDCPKESSKKKSDELQNIGCRPPLIQVIPLKKAGKCSTRMQDAITTMNRNKLLKIVSNGDLISLDHDYCRTLNLKISSVKQTKKLNFLIDKNPKKGSKMESSKTSHTIENAGTLENSRNPQSSEDNNSLLQNYLCIKKAEEEERTDGSKSEDLFSWSPKVNENNAKVNDISDSVKTDIASNGNKALTNVVSVINLNSEINNCSNSSVTIHSENTHKSEISHENECANKIQKEGNITALESTPLVQNERPRRKLKLEEYLNRRNEKEKEKKRLNSELDETPQTTIVAVDFKKEESGIKLNSVEANIENTKDELNENSYSLNNVDKRKEKDSCWNGFQKSTSLGDKKSSFKNERSHSRSQERIKGSKRSGRKHFKMREERCNSRKKNFSSGSSSRSPSTESSSSSDSSSKYRDNSYSNSRPCNYTDTPRNYNYYFNKMSTKRRSRSPYYSYSVREKQRQIEERRVIYVGRIEEGMTNAKLKKRFSIFGPIIDISLHFREYGDNYGFVTYAHKSDAYDAVEHGNDDPSLPRYDLCFGGRRGFCKEKYADLDGMPTSYSELNDSSVFHKTEDSFDLLLKEAQAKLKNRKKQ